MLTITFINDGSGTEIEGNYRFKVEINGRKISEGVMLGHNRCLGWEGLVAQFANDVFHKTWKPTDQEHLIRDRLSYLQNVTDSVTFCKTLVWIHTRKED